jgi:LmbE family N-acetylglucosaminyl deacetylase
MKTVSRRDLMQRTGLLGAALARMPSAIAAQPDPAQASRRKILVAGGHPGDPEYGCGGTIARLTDQGHEVVLLYLNNGERPGIAPDAHGVRTGEANKACEILKARPLFAGQIDGEAVVDAAHADAFRKVLEAEQPAAVFTHWPIDNHADHRAMSMLVYSAWLKMRKAFALFYYEVSNGEDTVQFAPTQYVDISTTAPRKRQACYAHASQAPDKFYALQEMVTKMRGLESGHREAEAYIRHVQGPEFPLPGGS